MKKHVLLSEHQTITKSLNFSWREMITVSVCMARKTSTKMLKYTHRKNKYSMITSIFYIRSFWLKTATQKSV